MLVAACTGAALGGRVTKPLEEAQKMGEVEQGLVPELPSEVVVDTQELPYWEEEPAVPFYPPLEEVLQQSYYPAGQYTFQLTSVYNSFKFQRIFQLTSFYLSKT
jgi:hypothetical protein